MTQKLLDPVAAFREWTRGTSFTLNMGKTQVATLVALHASQDLANRIGAAHRALRWFIPATRGLEERGLVVYHPWLGQERPKTYGKIFEVTTAGNLVVGLLQITGVYEELYADFLRSDGVPANRLRKIMLQARREIA